MHVNHRRGETRQSVWRKESRWTTKGKYDRKRKRCSYKRVKRWFQARFRAQEKAHMESMHAPLPRWRRFSP